MKIAIHQPEHFPYLGFFQKMQAVDLFVILDNVKFKKNNFQNRNRFLNRSGTEEWFTVPVEKHCNSKLINEIIVSPDPHWRKKVIKQIFFNLKHDISEIYEHKSMLLDINMASIRWCMEKLKLDKTLVFSSQIDDFQNLQKSELLVAICKSLNAKTYLSGLGAKNYLDENCFLKHDINVEFLESSIPNAMSTIYNV